MARQYILKVNIPDIDDQWDEQEKQYPAKGEPGIRYQRFVMGASSNAVVETLLYYNSDRTLAGVFTYYPNDIPAPPDSWQATLSNSNNRFLERAGTFHVIVNPSRQKAGIGRKLLQEATKRWSINFEQQQYTRAGAALVESFLRGQDD